jgi:ribosomal protein L10
MAVAQTKVAVGRVRSKFKQSNALWVLDGDSLLEEGKTELTNLRQELKDSTQLVYGID